MKALNERQQRAVIYCRVSGKKQLTGSGLGSQEHRCRQYAEAKGYEVVEVFPDDKSAEGRFLKRPGMVKLLSFLDDHPTERFVVIFDDLKRYSRDTEFHLELRRIMLERGAIREFLNFTFEDTPEGKLNETVTAAAGTYERESNARQTRQKTIARLEQGYCVQAVPPVGYKYFKPKGRGGKELQLDEPAASIVREALEGFASGRFASQIEVMRFLESQPEFPKKGKNGTIVQQSVVDMMRRHLYAGLVDGRAWGVSIREGRHEGLISVATFERIQQKLDGRVYAPARKDVSVDFPLRGAVCCSQCNTPLTAGWSKGRRQKYPYYFCRSKGCAMYGKTIPRRKIEGEFVDLLSRLQPSRTVLEIVATMFRDVWNTQLEKSSVLQNALKRNLSSIEHKIEKVLDAVVEATNPRVIAAYERQIDKLERETLILQEKQRQNGEPPGDFNDLFEHSVRFLSSPCNIWKTGRIEMQRLVLKLAFSGHLQYCRERGFRTPQTTVPFGFLEDYGVKKEMVPGGGFEPPTRGFSIRCSTPELPGQAKQGSGFLAALFALVQCRNRFFADQL